MTKTEKREWIKTWSDGTKRALLRYVDSMPARLGLAGASSVRERLRGS